MCRNQIKDNAVTSLISKTKKKYNQFVSKKKLCILEASAGCKRVAYIK